MLSSVGGNDVVEMGIQESEANKAITPKNKNCVLRSMDIPLSAIEAILHTSGGSAGCPPERAPAARKRLGAA